MLLGNTEVESMITPGHVKNGVVVPAEGVCLPEGLEVAIVAPIATTVARQRAWTAQCARHSSDQRWQCFIP